MILEKPLRNQLIRLSCYDSTAFSRMMFFQTCSIKSLWLFFFSLSLTVNSALLYAHNPKTSTDACHPSVNVNQKQFIVGYGSLMQQKSKCADASNVGESYPIYVTGYKRSWIMHGSPVGFSTTYLAVIRQALSKINAVYFRLNNPKDVQRYDKREFGYCRASLLPQHIKTITKDILPDGQYWIYIASDELNHPNPRYPIVQSYVDIFLSGCFELEKKYHIPGFARDCVQLTSGWSVHWVNDRIHPRRAFNDSPYAQKIDTLIATELPNYFNQIKIEG
jgi:hypothetical protein